MAAILQLRQGSTSTYISQGPNIAEPFFDTGSNILVVGKSATEVIKLTKLDESNNGSFSITGDYTGSNLYLSGNLTASNANLSGDITIGGNIILGDQVQDNITVSGQFDSDLIPSESLQYDLGSTTKKWNVLYASRVDATELTGSIQVTSTILPDANEVYDLGSPTQRFRDFYISSGSLRLGNAKISSPDNGNTVRFSGPRVQIGGLTGGRIEYNPTRNFLNLKGPSTDTSIPVVSSRVYLTGSNGEGYLEMGGDSNTIRFGQGAIQLGGNTGNRLAYNSTRNAIQFQGPTTEEVTPIISSKVILSGSNGEINLEVGADGNLSSSNSDGSQTQGTYSGSFSGDGSGLTFGGTNIVSGSSQLPSGVISSSAQLTLLGYDGYFGWSANADNSNSINISSGRTLYFEGGDGITTEARNPGNYYITIDLDTGSAHFTDAVAAVGAPAGTVSGSSQILDGSGILSSSQTSFTNFSQSIDAGVQNNFNYIEDLLSVSHSHSNKFYLDAINQNLASGSVVKFFSLQTGQVEMTGDLDVAGTASFDSNLTIYGDLTVFGTESIVNAENLSIADNMIYLNSGSTITNPDLGWAGNYNDGTYAHAGIFRDASDGIFKFYDSYTPEPEGSIDTSHASFVLAPIQALELTATLVSASDYQGDGSQLKFPGTNIVSSSQQVVNFLPSGLVSGSSQVITILNDNTVISGSSQLENIFFSQLYAPEIIGTDVTDVWNPALNRLATTYAIQKFISDEGIISGSSQISNIFFSQLYAPEIIGTDVTDVWNPALNRLATTYAIQKFISDEGVISGSSQIQSLLPSGTVSSSLQIIEILETQTPGLVSGSDQVTQSLDLRYATLGGVGLLSSSNENFSDFSQSVDLRLENTLDSGSATSQSLYLLTGNFPTSGSLGTAAFYNVSSSLADDPNVIPNVKAVYDYINNTIGAADITGVSASLGLFGGGNAGYVSLSLDTASAHFSDGVEKVLPSGVISGSGQISFPSSDNYGGWQFDGDNTNPIYVTSNRIVDFEGRNGIITEARNPGNYYLSIDLDTGSAHFADGVAAVSSAPAGTVSGSSQTLDHIESETLVGINISNPTSYGADGELQINGTTDGYSGILHLLSGSISTYVNYASEVDKMINFQAAAGYGLQLTPDVNTSKAWTIDTDGDLFSNGTGDIYAQYLYADISNITITTASVSDREVLFKNTNNNIEGSSIYSVPSTSTIAINDSTPNSAGANGELIINGTSPGFSGILTQDIGGTTVYNQYATSNDGLVNFLAGGGYGLYFSVDGNSKSWVIDTDGDLVAGGNYDIYAQDFRATGDISGSDLFLTNNIQLGGNLIVGSSTITPTEFSYLDGVTSDIQTQINSLTGGTGSYVDLVSEQTISGTKTFNNIVVNGTGSFAYLESVTGSAKLIGDAYIVLNNNTPTERYAGIAVYDSGSIGVTSSLEFDGELNDWFYEYSDDGGATTDHGVVIFGPEYSTKGSPTYPTNNRIQKGNGGHHLLDSNISDDGTTITLNSTTNITGVTTTTAVSSSLGFTSTAQKGLLVDNGDGYIQIGSGTVTTELGQNDGSGYGYLQFNDTGFNSDEFRILVGGTTMMHLSKADASDTGTNAVQIKNTDFSVDYDTLFVDATNDRVGINKIAPTVALDVVGDIAATGDITAYASSDRRLKEEITPISNPIEKISQIGGYSFVWNTEKQHIYKGKDYGVIAQEIEEILPELVDTRENGYKAVKYDRLVSLLIEGIKELSLEVKELKEKINNRE